MHDQRRYVRMGTVFPVEFAIVGANGGPDKERLLQGFTCNVSEGGMCIEFKSFGKEDEDTLRGSGASLSLTINPTFSREPIQAHARVVWLKKEEHAHFSRYLIGVSYETIDPAARKRLISYARRMRLLPVLVIGALTLLLASLVFSAFHAHRLTRENLKLADQLRQGASARSQVAGELVSLADNRRALESELLKLRDENERLEKGIAGMNAEVTELSAQSSRLKLSHSRETEIRAKLESILSDQEKLRGSYQVLEESGRENSAAALRWMSQWLSSHQNLRTGLVASFEGDPSLTDDAFVYDQALAAQVFLLSGESKRAEAILSFFDSRADSEGGAFFNAYDTSGGSPQETILHAGPNLWLGIAALQHARLGDKRFVPMARRIGDWVMRLQDKEGGVPGGPGISWYSTEHNLDAYAFFGMLAKASGDEKYGRAQAGTLEWLKKYAYSNPNQAVNRGKGDATIATDTFAWSVAALGPAKLVEIGQDPEGILEFAQTHCAVTVDFKQPDGKTVKVSGFDFAKAKNIGRGGVVSTEWTAQMIVSYQVLARYFKTAGDADKARRYLEKAEFYRNELQKMIITSPSRTGQGRGCLPYASADNVDTGHGWRTPKGTSTGSVAGTAYGLFAWKGYNPFEPGGGE